MSSFYANKLENAIGKVFAFTIGTESLKAPLTYKTVPGNVEIQARQPSLVRIKVVTEKIEKDFPAQPLWEGKLPVAQLGVLYNIPIPAAPVFGKQVFSASFLESGALSSVQYASNGGVGQALNAISSAQTTLKGETTAQKAAEVKAEGDLIANQQRLVQCMVNSGTCK